MPYISQLAQLMQYMTENSEAEILRELEGEENLAKQRSYLLAVAFRLEHDQPS